MRKITWEISIEGYGPQCMITAPTRSLAISKAESAWIADHDWQKELPENERAKCPEFTARKVQK